MNKKVASLCVLALGAAGIYGMVGDSLKADDQQNETLAPAQSSTDSKASETEVEKSKEPEESAEVDGQTNEGEPAKEIEEETVSTETKEETASSEGTTATTEVSKENVEEPQKESSNESSESSKETSKEDSTTQESSEASKEETKETSSSNSTSTESTTETVESSEKTEPSTNVSQSSKENSKEETNSTVVPPEESQVAPEGSPVVPTIKKEEKKEASLETPPVIQDARGDLSMNILDNFQISLTPDFLVSEVAKSDLKGYELPLLSSFEDKNRGILIYEGIKQLEKAKDVKDEKNIEETPTTVAENEKEKEDHYKNGFVSTEDLLNQMTQELFQQNFYDIQESVDAKATVKAGAILYSKDNQLVGLYLGSDYYLTVKKDKDEERMIPSIEKLTSQMKKEMYQRVLSEVELTEYGKKVKEAYPASIEFQKNKQTEDFIKSIGKSAQKLGEKYDVFASVMIAQAILESGSGESQLARMPNYNLFGMKGNYKGQSVTFDTKEDRGNGELYTIQAAFRRYNSYNESLGDYVALIRGGIQGDKKFYEGARRSKAKNYLTATDFLTGKYATDTQYNRKLSSLIAVYHLSEFDKLKNQKTGPILKGKDKIPEEYKSLMTFPDYNGKDYNTSGSYPVGQCTWYAYNRVAQLGKHVDEFMGNGGEWGAKGEALGYNVTDVPTAGYLISFTPGTAGSDPEYGHVAFVEAVGENGILISEGNVVGGNTISYRIIPNELAKSDLVSYIEPK